MRVKLDTCAQVNILLKSTFDKLGKHLLKQSKVRLRAFGGNNLDTLGVGLQCSYKGIKRVILLHDMANAKSLSAIMDHNTRAPNL